MICTITVTMLPPPAGPQPIFTVAGSRSHQNGRSVLGGGRRARSYTIEAQVDRQAEVVEVACEVEAGREVEVARQGCVPYQAYIACRA